MILEDEKSNDQVDATFIKEDYHTNMIGELQEIIYNLHESNFEESVDKIVRIGFTSDLYIIDLARNIIRLSCFQKLKHSLLVRLVSRLKHKSDIITQKEHLVGYGIEIEAQTFLLSLIISNLINKTYESSLELPKNIKKCGYLKSHRTVQLKLSEEEKRLHEVIEEDNIEYLKQLFAQPNYDINQKHVFCYSIHFSCEGIIRLSTIEFAALCGSIKCFKFLYINGANLEVGSYYDIMKCAIAGGNIDIIQILEQSNIGPDPSCIPFAISFHRIEIFDWLIDQFPDTECSMECFKNEFVHGFKRIKMLIPQEAFDLSCECGLVSIIKILVSNFSIDVEKGLIRACHHGHIEVVKFLLSLPSINVNISHVFFRKMMLISDIFYNST